MGSNWTKMTPLADKRIFLGNSTKVILYLLTAPYHAAKFEKHPLSRSRDKRLHNFGPQLG